MRLKRRDIEVFIAVLDSRVKKGAAELYLFGSRVQDHLKGGDIDLLVLAPSPTIKALQSEKHFLLAEFKKETGDQRVDLTLAEAPLARKDPFIRHALQAAVLLKKWKRPRKSS
jgi:predicted nucleotidyltransferase